MLPSTPEEKQAIIDYMNSQAPDLPVEFLQKVYVENVLSHQHAGLGCSHKRRSLVGDHQPDEPLPPRTVSKYGFSGHVPRRPMSACPAQRKVTIIRIASRTARRMLSSHERSIGRAV